MESIAKRAELEVVEIVVVRQMQLSKCDVIRLSRRVTTYRTLPKYHYTK
jgi:hypothetical protein